MSRACELGLSGSLFLYNTTQFLQIAPSSLDIASEGSTKGEVMSTPGLSVPSIVIGALSQSRNQECGQVLQSHM